MKGLEGSLPISKGNSVEGFELDDKLSVVSAAASLICLQRGLVEAVPDVRDAISFDAFAQRRMHALEQLQKWSNDSLLGLSDPLLSILKRHVENAVATVQQGLTQNNLYAPICSLNECCLDTLPPVPLLPCEQAFLENLNEWFECRTESFETESLASDEEGVIERSAQETKHELFCWMLGAGEFVPDLWDLLEDGLPISILPRGQRQELIQISNWMNDPFVSPDQQILRRQMAFAISDWFFQAKNAMINNQPTPGVPILDFAKSEFYELPNLSNLPIRGLNLIGNQFQGVLDLPYSITGKIWVDGNHDLHAVRLIDEAGQVVKEFKRDDQSSALMDSCRMLAFPRRAQVVWTGDPSD